jgi:hypothetical protein
MDVYILTEESLHSGLTIIGVFDSPDMASKLLRVYYGDYTELSHDSFDNELSATMPWAKRILIDSPFITPFKDEVTIKLLRHTINKPL